MAKVIDVRTEEKSRADKVLADRRRSLHIAQKQVETAKAAAAKAAADAAKLQDAAKALRNELKRATLKADIDRLGNALQDNDRAQRSGLALVRATADAQAEAEQRAADLTAAVDAAQKAADAAGRAYDEAGKQEELLASWRAALQAQSTVDAVDKAKKVTATDDYNKAAKRLERLLGHADVLGLYRDRAVFASEMAAVSSNLLLDAIDLAADARADVEPLTADRMKAATTLARQIDAVQDAAEATVSRVDAAVKTLAELAARDTAVEGEERVKAQLAELAKRAGGARAVDAVAKEMAVIKARRDLSEAERLEEVAEVAAVADNPDVPAEEQPEAADEQAATKTAKTALETAEKALANPVKDPDDAKVKVAPKTLLDDYELAVPADVLADVIAFLDAELVLDKASKLVLDDLADDLDSAESDYADKEKSELLERRAVALVDAVVEARRRRHTASAGTAAAHKLLTIRGDR